MEGLELHYYAGAEVETKVHADVLQTYKTDRGVFTPKVVFQQCLDYHILI